MLFDLISLTASGAYIALMLLGLLRVLQGIREKSLFEFERAMRFYLAAAFFQLINLGSNLLDIAEDGWTGVAVSAFNLLLVGGTIALTGKRADRMEGIQ
jgi:hypothetical protein